MISVGIIGMMNEMTGLSWLLLALLYLPSSSAITNSVSYRKELF
jgi:hypothetical protein